MSAGVGGDQTGPGRDDGPSVTLGSPLALLVGLVVIGSFGWRLTAPATTVVDRG